MTANDHRPAWEWLDHNSRNDRFADATRASVEPFARSLVNGRQAGPSPVAEAAEQILRAENTRRERQRAAQEQGFAQGWPGE